MTAASGYSAIVLAAQRSGGGPLSALTGNRHKCLIDIHGRPMISRVLETLLAAPMIKHVLVSIEDQSVLDGVPEVADARVRVVASADNLYASVRQALAQGDDNWPALITTADNLVLTVEMVTHFCREFERANADAAAAMTRAGVMQARYPDGQLRFHGFRDDAYANCNLYALRGAGALRAASVFRTGGQFRKKIMRIARAFGLFNLILYKLRVLTLAGFARHLSRRFGVRLALIEMPFAEAPIDVDDERTLRVAREIIEQRQQASEGRG